jgi:hypothetical protein
MGPPSAAANKRPPCNRSVASDNGAGKRHKPDGPAAISSAARKKKQAEKAKLQKVLEFSCRARYQPGMKVLLDDSIYEKRSQVSSNLSTLVINSAISNKPFVPLNRYPTRVAVDCLNTS